MHDAPLQRVLECYRVELAGDETVVSPDAGFVSHPDAQARVARRAPKRGPALVARARSRLGGGRRVGRRSPSATKEAYEQSDRQQG